MKKPDYHILICNSYRVAGDAKGFCNKNGGAEFIQYVTEECNDRGIDAAVSSTACLNVCSQGPIMVIQPNNFWYGAITTERIDEILNALEEGEAVEEYLISE
jgi:(2Fe-2S) ferredoxin